MRSSSVRIPRFSALLIALAPAALCATQGHAQTWDGAVSGKISAIDVTASNNYGFRVYIAGNPVMCTGGAHYAYIIPGASNYETFVSALLTAYALNKTVVIYSMNTGNTCNFQYITVQN